MSRQNDSPRVIGGVRAQGEGARSGFRMDRIYSKTITVVTGGYLDSLPASERYRLVNEELSQTALDWSWDVRVAGQRWYNN